MRAVETKANIRKIGLTLIAGFTTVLLAKGMALAALADDWAWALAFCGGCCFWAVGMFEWPEEDC